MSIDPRARFRIESAVFFVAVLGFCGTATQWHWFRTLDLAFYDSIIESFPMPLRDDVILVGVDEQTLDGYGSWPWPRDLQGRLIEAIQDGSPAAILVDFVYGGYSNSQADAALVTAASAVDVLALPVIVDALATRRQMIEVLPYAELLETADVLGHVHVELDTDGIARGVYLFQGIGRPQWPHLTLALGQALHQNSVEVPDCGEQGEFSIQNQRCGFVFLSFAGPPGSYPEISARDLLEGSISPEQLRGKVVLVGITAAAAPDSITSPVSGNDRPMSGVEFNANLYSALLQGRTIREGSLGLLHSVALFCAVLPVLVLPRLKAKPMLLTAVTFAVIPMLISLLALTVFRLHLPLAAAFVTCLLSYPYWSWRRHEVAWQFVNAEISRVELEKSRWAFSGPTHSVEQDVAHLQDLLQADAVWYEASPSVQHSRQISVPADNGRWLVLSRSSPFSPAERALVARLQVKFRSSPDGEDRLPGEMLAAQIRKLQDAARAVRLGREVGLQGLAEMPNGVAVVSALNQVLFVNQACQKLLKLPANVQELDLATLTEGLVPPLGSSWMEISRDVLLRRETVSFETQTNSSIPVVVDAAPLFEPGEVPESWVITITDMTDIRIAERNREEALAFLSHDLRSPMLSVLALVRRGDGSSLLQDIDRYTQKALSVSEQFLQLSRVQAREHFETYELDLLLVLDSAIDQVYPTAQEKHLSVGFEHPQELQEGAWITGNGELLERAFINLLSNAIKFSDPAGSVDVTLTTTDSEHAVSVQDRGAGIPADEVEHVFEPYFRSTEPRLATRRGAGLGLRFVKTVVERHGGTVSVASTLGEGSRFTVTLPRPAETLVGDDLR